MPRRKSTLTVSWSWYLDVPVHPLLTDFSGTITFVFATTLLSASIRLCAVIPARADLLPLGRRHERP